MKTDTSKSTILVISTGFLILHLVFTWQWAVYVSLAAGVIGIASTTLSRKIEWAWMTLARLLNYVVPSILLGIIFYFILFPLSLLSKFWTRDPLKLSGNYPTCFVDIDKEFDKNSFEKTW